MSHGGRRTRPWGPLKGSSEDANALAQMLRRWLDEAELRLDDLVAELTPEHFTSGRVPARTTVAERLAGVGLRWDFVEAVADICSCDDASRARLLKQGRLHMGHSGTEMQQRTGGSEPSPGRSEEDQDGEAAKLAAELVVVQRQSLAVSDQLLRAMERVTELEQARNNANHLVLVLLAMVDKLQRDIATLAAERTRLRTAGTGEDLQRQVRERLERSEAQRALAEAELARARAEREQADRLAEQASEQARALTEELERLRRCAPQAAEEPTPTPAPPAAVERAPDAVVDDIDQALATAARYLDGEADRLDRLADELRQEVTVTDNSSASGDAADNSPDNPQPTPRDIARTAQAAHTAGKHDEATRILTTAAIAQPYTGVLETVAALRETGHHADADQVLTLAGLARPAKEVLALTVALREAERDADAYQVLSAVGRVRPPLEVPPVIAALREDSKHADAEWVLTAASRDRLLEEVPRVVDALQQTGNHADADKVHNVYMDRIRVPHSPSNHATEQFALPSSHRDTALPEMSQDPHGQREEHYSDDLCFDIFPGDHPAYPTRLYALTGGRTRARYEIADQAVVSTTLDSSLLRGLLPEHQRICHLCRESKSVAEISAVLAIPRGVTRILVADLIEEGVVTIHQPADIDD